MALNKEAKKDLVLQYADSEANTGSTAAQIAILSERVKQLTQHMQDNPKDFSTRRGLLKLVGKRRRLQHYFRAHHTPEEYKALLARLGLRK